jgi:hypothetical protein
MLPQVTIQLLCPALICALRLRLGGIMSGSAGSRVFFSDRGIPLGRVDSGILSVPTDVFNGPYAAVNAPTKFMRVKPIQLKGMH